ncbi:hypothetical protein LXL04_034622 [Taraxacum kok-saghyz]
MVEIPIPPKWKQLWNTWDLRGFIILSLSLQTFLILVAPLRKRTKSNWIIMPLWSAYLLADWAANFAVGLISNSQDKNGDKIAIKNDDLLAFWAPFLLVHLAVYVFVQSLPQNRLWIPTMLMFFTGIIKYAERTRSLYLASADRFKDSMLTDPDPGPNYAKLMNEYFSKKCWVKENGIGRRFVFLTGGKKLLEQVRSEEVGAVKRKKIMTMVPAKEGASMSYQIPVLTPINYSVWVVKMKSIMDAYGLWETVEPRNLGEEPDLKKKKQALAFLFQAIPEEMVLQMSDYTDPKRVWEGLKTRYLGVDRVRTARLATLKRELESLRMKEGEIVDDFAAKLSGLASKARSLGHELEEVDLVKRLLDCMPKSFLQIVASIEQWFELDTMLFDEAIGRLKAYEERIKGSEKMEDIHGGLYLSREEKSDGCMHCGSGGSHLDGFGRGRGRGRGSGRSQDGKERVRDKSHVKCYKCGEFGHYNNECPKWENEANLITEEEPALIRKERNQSRDFFLNRTAKDSFKVVEIELNFIYERLLIFEEVKEKSELADDLETAKEISSARGDWVICVEQGWGTLLKNVVDVDYDQSLILWHIATELCYNKELQKSPINAKKDGRDIAKLLSNYMLYLLIMQPSMMSAVAGIGQIRFRYNCAEAKRLFDNGESREDAKEEHNKKVPPVTIKGDRSKSLLFDSCILAKELMEIEEKDTSKNKWLIISKVWVELLCYGASHSRANTQASQVSKGGELITIVWLLMADFGLGDQFQINEDQARAKLIVGK